MPYPWVLRRSLKFGTLIVMPCAWVLSEKPKYATPYFDMQATLRVSFSSLKLGSTSLLSCFMGARERPKFHFVQHEVTVMPCGWVFRRGLSLRRHNLSYAGFRKVLRKKKLRK